MGVIAQSATEGDHDQFYLRHLQVVRTPQATYVNHRRLGRGGNGTAFLVTCCSGKHAGVQMVLKAFHRISDNSRRKAFDDEVKTLKELDHPCVIRVFDEGDFFVGQDRSYPFALMEYVPTTVRQLLAKRQVERLQAIRIVLNCLSALVYIHTRSKQIVHRDIKPENILLSESGAKLADFGLAKQLEELVQELPSEGEDTGAIEMDTETGGYVAHSKPVISSALQKVPSQRPGMPSRYRTPELIARAQNPDAPLTTASDVYQLGTVFHELLTDRNPQISPDNLLDPIRLEILSIGGQQGKEITTLLEHMLCDKPSDRPTAAECRARLERIHEDLCQSMTEIMGRHF